MIVVDGMQGGTAATQDVFIEHVGIPTLPATRIAADALQELGTAPTGAADRLGWDPERGGCREGARARRGRGLDRDGSARRDGRQQPRARRGVPRDRQRRRVLRRLAGGPRPDRDLDAGRRARGALRSHARRAPHRELPPRAHARDADARPRVRQVTRPQPRAGGSRRAHGRGGGDGEGPARRHGLDSGRRSAPSWGDRKPLRTTVRRGAATRLLISVRASPRPRSQAEPGRSPASRRSATGARGEWWMSSSAFKPSAEPIEPRTCSVGRGVSDRDAAFPRAGSMRYRTTDCVPRGRRRRTRHDRYARSICEASWSTDDQESSCRVRAHALRLEVRATRTGGRSPSSSRAPFATDAAGETPYTCAATRCDWTDLVNGTCDTLRRERSDRSPEAIGARRRA